MKKLLFLLSFILFVTLIVIVSCNKENQYYKSKGVIYGIDGTMCGCCGGWQIEINNVGYLFDGVPENSNFSLNIDSLPISVKLDWQLINNGCPNKRITIQRIKKE